MLQGVTLQELFGVLEDFSVAVSQIENYLMRMNVGAQRAQKSPVWLIRNIGTRKGGLNIDVVIRIIPEMQGTIVIEAFTNFLPDPTAPGFNPSTMLALCRDLLEFNGTDTSGDAYFAIRELPDITGRATSPAIVVESRRPLRDLDYEEFVRAIIHVATLADENDERLTREFRAPKIRF